MLSMFLKRRLAFAGNKAFFQKQLLKNVWKFAAGMSGIAVMSIILTQMDKVILSRMLSLEMFGYYTLAGSVAMALGFVFTPVFSAVYPMFTQSVSINDQEGRKRLYHKSCQFMSVLVLPAATVVAFFSHEIILLWQRNQTTAQETYILVSILICGAALNGLMNLPYALQLASGWTRLSFFKSMIFTVLLVPLIIYATVNYGAVGAASVWVILNMCSIIFEIPIMHLRLLRKETCSGMDRLLDWDRNALNADESAMKRTVV